MRNLLFVLLLVLSACASNHNGISATGMAAVSGETGGYQSFHVVAKDLPVFLGPVIVSNFSVAMAERGYQPVSSGGEIEATVFYEQDNLPVESDDVRFVARVGVTLSVAEGGAPLFQGNIQRLHTVQAGEYMHVGDASISFLEAFREMIADLPIRANLEE